MQPVLHLILALGLLLGSLTSSTPQASPQTGYAAEDLLAIKPELRDQVAANLPAGMTEYDIELEIPDEDPSTEISLSGWQQVTVTNTTSEQLFQLPFRLYANGASIGHNALEIESVTSNGDDLTWELSELDTVAMITLGDVLPVGESVTLEMEFTLHLPVNDPSHYGILNHSTENRTSVMAHWYPVLAGRDPETGWMLKPASVYGDPIFTDAGMYEVTISAPAVQNLITSGVETGREESDGRQQVTYNAMPSRDFVIVMSDVMESTTAEIDGTTVTSWAMPNHGVGRDAVLEWTVNTLEVFNPLLGEYPWLELNAIEAPVYSAAAVELPQMFVMGSSYYTDPDLTSPISYFEFTVAHEAVHMWFYSLVGNNQYDDAFIDEGLTNYLSGSVYFREMYGDEIGDAAFQMFLYRPFERMIESNADVIVDFPTDNFPSASAYSSAVYTKAPHGFRAIHEAMGNEPFFAALSAYIEEFSFHVATPADLEGAFQRETDVDIREIWSHWFEKREGGLDIQGVRPVWIG